MKISKKTRFFIIILISLASIYFHGYSFSTGDTTFQVPQILKRTNPDLFRSDYLSTTTEGEFSLFFPIMALLIKFSQIDIEWLYFVLYIIFHFIFLYAVYLFCYKLTQNSQASIIATLLLCLPKFVGGTTITTLDISWMPRFASLPLLFTAFWQVISEKYVLASLLTGFIFLLHPFSAIILGIYLAGFMIFNQTPYLTWLKTILVGLTVTIWYLIRKINIIFSRQNPTIIPEDWYQIIITRVPYNYLSLWKVTGWGSLLIVICLGFGLIKYFSKNSKVGDSKLAQLLKRVFLIAILTSIAQYILVEKIRLTLFTQLQLLRIWLIPVYLVFMLAAVFISRLWAKKTILAQTISLVVFIVLASNFSKIPTRQLETPWTPKREWDNLQIWINEHTSPDSVIITPATRIGFRIHSQRSIVGEIKDGSASLYSYSLAKSWAERIDDLDMLKKTEAEILNLKYKYQADYLVNFKQKSYPNFTPIHETETFIVYKL